MADLIFPLQNDTSRKIIHIDMDAFYASVEERDHPEFRGQPLVIAKHPNDTNGHGVVATANYEARKYGIHSAMSAKEAYERCPQAIFCPGNRSYYAEVSAQIHDIFREYTDIIEPVALDEAYLDVTENKKQMKSAIKIAMMIREDIYNKLHLTCSAGISYNKFLAKLASDYRKPNGITWVLPDEAIDFLKPLPIERFNGIGKKTVPIMHEMGVYTGEDLLQVPEMTLIQKFGKMGYDLYRKARGIHNAPVKAERERKSIGTERTYNEPIRTENQFIPHLREQAERVANSLKKHHKKGKTVVLKIRYTNFETITKRTTLIESIQEAEEIFDEAFHIWQEIDQFKDGLRLIGITMTNLEAQDIEWLVLPL